jgi:exosortase/archaeosortase family protein
MARLIETRRYYVVAFFALFVLLYALYSAGWSFLPAYYAALASSVCWLFGWFDPAVGCDANYLLYDDIRELVVVEGCDGLTFVALILAAVLPFPAPWKRKLIGLAWLIPALLVVNWLRLVLLAAVRFYAPSGFDFVHVYLFQPLMIAFTLIIFLLWLGPRYAAPKEA